jgi:hypothetical protein
MSSLAVRIRFWWTSADMKMGLAGGATIGGRNQAVYVQHCQCMSTVV